MQEKAQYKYRKLFNEDIKSKKRYKREYEGNRYRNILKED